MKNEGGFPKGSVLAFDNDEGGEKLTEEVKKIYSGGD